MKIDFCGCDECELMYLLTALSNSLTRDLTVGEIIYLSRIFSQLSHTLSTIAAHKQICQDSQKTKIELKNQSKASDDI